MFNIINNNLNRQRGGLQPRPMQPQPMQQPMQQHMQQQPQLMQQQPQQRPLMPQPMQRPMQPQQVQQRRLMQRPMMPPQMQQRRPMPQPMPPMQPLHIQNKSNMPQQPPVQTPLMAIKSKNMVFISTQPDNAYFHWQVEVYMHQFSKFGIQDNCYILFAYPGSEPSEGAKNLKKIYKNVYWYKDERENRSYIPTIRPHLLAKFFKEYPHLAKNFLYHDADIIFTKLPDFSLMLNDNISYLSDTVGYIGYKYIMDCCKRYKAKYPELADDDLFLGMCKVVSIDPKLVIANQDNSGGAQLLLKNTNWQFWDECEKTCNKLYKYLCEYEQKYPIPHHIQKWTAEMWAILWDFWKMGGVTKIHKELDFSWATDTMDQYNSKNIFHLAGVTEETCKERFFKSRYTNKDVIAEYIKDNSIFDNIISTSATYGYTRLIIECAKKRGVRIDNSKTVINTTTTRPPTAPTAPTVAPKAPTAPKAPNPTNSIGRPIRACELSRNSPHEQSIDPLEERKQRLEERLRIEKARNMPTNNEFNNHHPFKFHNRHFRIPQAEIVEQLETTEQPLESVESVESLEQPLESIEQPAESIEQPAESVEPAKPIKPLEQLETVNINNYEDTSELKNINMDRLNYFDKRKIAYALLNNISLKDVINDNNPQPVALAEPEQKPEPVNVFSKFICININDTLSTVHTTTTTSTTTTIKVEPPKYVTKLIIEGEHYCATTYVIDETVFCCKKNIWRSIDNNYIIFFNGSVWIITYASSEKEIGPTSGGIVSNLSADLSVNRWNFECTAKIIKDVL